MKKILKFRLFYLMVVVLPISNSSISGLDNAIKGTIRQLFGKKGESRSRSSISNGCTQHRQKCWTAEGKH